MAVCASCANGLNDHCMPELASSLGAFVVQACCSAVAVELRPGCKAEWAQAALEHPKFWFNDVTA